MGGIQLACSPHGCMLEECVVKIALDLLKKVDESRFVEDVESNSRNIWSENIVFSEVNKLNLTYYN